MQNSARYFENHSCASFPCHKISGDSDGKMNCLFCFCPLYSLNPCPGNPKYIQKENGKIKSCIDCVFPHNIENYEHIMNYLRTKKTPDFSKQFIHGGANFLQTKQNVSLDFSVNINPLGLMENVKKNLQEKIDSVISYPDPNCTELTNALSAFRNIPRNQILFGNGASDLIQTFVHALFLRSAIIVEPSFSGYERSLLSVQCAIHRVRLFAENDFSFDDSILLAIEKIKPDAIFICSPANPYGKNFSLEQKKELIRVCKKTDTWIFFDECFLGFAEDGWKTSAVQFFSEYNKIVVLDAFTKIFALPGLRLGMCFSPNTDLILKLKFFQSEWAVSSLAQCAGLACLSSLSDLDSYLLQTRKLVKEEKEKFYKKFSDFGFTVFPSDANFLLFKADKNLSKMLLQKHQILIRDCSLYFGLGEDFFRTAILLPEQNEKLCSSILKCLEKK